MNYIICHYHEIALKGKNRKFFEEKLIQNIKKGLDPSFFEWGKRISGEILFKLTEKGLKNQDKIEKSLKNVFGIAYFTFALSCEQKIEIIKKNSLKILKNKKFKTFRISSKRSRKDFYLNSQQINEKIGEHILKNLNCKVNLSKPNIICFIEIVEKYAFLYTKKIKGQGGLPISTGGKAICLISGGIDSPVAAFKVMKRGVKIIFLHFHAYPYTQKASIEKVEKLVKVLNKFHSQSKLYLVPFANIQKEILIKTPSSLRVILYRRMMFRIAKEVAKKEKALALVTGESIGQVASQTLENIRTIEESVDILVLRPLISDDKQEIIEKAEEIGTFNISIIPHEDCCTRFLPKHPETKSKIEMVKRAEEKLDFQNLIKKTIKDINIKIIK